MRKKILVRGPVLSQSGYGEQSRFALRALRSREDLFEIFVIPTKWGNTGWVWENSELRKWMDEKIALTQVLIQRKQLQADISLQITIPNEFEKIAPINIGYTAGIETTAVSPQWLQKGNEVVDKILVVSNHAKTTYKDTVVQAVNKNTNESFPYKLETPIEVVWENTPRAAPEPIKELNLKTDFNFLSISQVSPRKNFENTVKWFVEEFIDQNVGLILKTNLVSNSYIDWEHIEARITGILSSYSERKCKVYLLHGDLTPGQMTWLYNHNKIKGIVNISHGEGFGLPLFEAAREGLPVTTIAWSGQLDYLVNDNKEYFNKVDYTLQPVQTTAVWPGVIEENSMWAYADQGSYKMALRKLYKNHTSFEETAKELKVIVGEKFSNESLYKNFISHFHEEETPGVTVEDLPKISLITSVYKADEYIEQLMEDVTRQTIFKEKCEWIILNANPEGHDFEEEVIKKYMEKFPNNIVYKRLEEDPGIYDTWNMGIKMSTGDFITNVNCDDRRPAWAYEKQAKLLVANSDVELVYNDSYVTHEPNIMWEEVKPDTQRYNFEQFSKEAMLRSNLPHNNPMWRRTVHDKYGYFNQYYKSAADWDFWLRCSFGGSKFKKCRDVLGVYYFNPTGMSTNPAHDAWKKEHEREIFQNYLMRLQKES